MATVSDLTGNRITVSDLGFAFPYDDSNVNVFEFGNLILADILPTIRWAESYIIDVRGNAVSASDIDGSIISESDISGSSSSVVDMSGS